MKVDKCEIESCLNEGVSTTDDGQLLCDYCLEEWEDNQLEICDHRACKELAISYTDDGQHLCEDHLHAWAEQDFWIEYEKELENER